MIGCASGKDLLRGRRQLPFVLLVPEDAGFGQDCPQLVDPQANVTRAFSACSPEVVAAFVEPSRQPQRSIAPPLHLRHRDSARTREQILDEYRTEIAQRPAFPVLETAIDPGRRQLDWS